MQLQIQEKGEAAVKTDFPTFHSSHVTKYFPKDSDSQCDGNKTILDPRRAVICPTGILLLCGSEISARVLTIIVEIIKLRIHL